MEHKEYAEAYSANSREVEEKDGADLLEKVLSRDNLNRAYKRVHPIYVPKFSDGSYGYRPHRSAKDAITKVREYADKGYQYSVCIDLSKYFDTLNHELLMNMIREDIKDKRLIDLIKKYLKSGVMENWNGCLWRRIRMYIWMQWKKPKTRVENLKKLRMPEW